MKDQFENEKIARVAYKVNSAYCESLGDMSFTDWEDAPDWQKSTLMKGVEFHRNNPNAGPSQSHDEWLKEKEKNGWTYGAIKDEGKKEHPCFVPYNDLPLEQKAKDYIFQAVVHSLID